MNLPPGGDYVNVFTIPGADGSVATQFAHMWGSPFRMWSRSRNEVGAWSAWVERVQQSFASVEQGGGVGQTTNKVRMGWSASNKLLAQVDGLELGVVWADQYSPSSKAVTGYQRLANNILLQWGNVSPTTGTQNFPFPLVFSAIYGMQITPTGGAGADTIVSQWVSGTSTSGFTLSTRRALNGGLVDSIGFPAYWFAIGLGA